MTPLILLIDDQEWTSRSIESILRPKGHVVLKAYTGHQGLELVQKVSPDLIIVDFHLPDLNGIDVARGLQAAPTVQAATPVLMISASMIDRAERLEALEAGVWDILRHPLDPAELVLRVETLVRAKQLADRLRDEGLTDPVTGCYNAIGLLRRTQEITADATRSERPLACVALGPEWVDRTSDAGEAASKADLLARSLAPALQSEVRASDMVGRLASGELVIVAPGTDGEGALRLASRVLGRMQERLHEGGEGGVGPARSGEAEMARVRAGFYATVATSPVDPEDILFKATIALRRAQVENSGPFVRAYDA